MNAFTGEIKLLEIETTPSTIGINDSNDFQIVDLMFEDVRGFQD
jgi:hypothetical protein